MEIRELPPEYVPDTIALWHAAGLTKPWNDPEADLRRAVVGPSSTVLAALADDTLLGTVMVGHDGHRGWIYYLAVDEAHRRSGLGSALMAAAEEWLGDRDVPKVQLMVRHSNTEVVSFYEALGYADQSVVVLGKFFDSDQQQLRGAAASAGKR